MSTYEVVKQDDQLPKQIGAQDESDASKSNCIEIEVVNDVKDGPQPAAKVETSNTRDLLVQYLQYYVNKFTGVSGKKAPKIQPFHEAIYSSIISFIGILLISVTDYWYLNRTFGTGHDTYVNMLTGSFAATAVLVYDLHSSPVAQPRNVIGGHVISAFIGVSVRRLSLLIGTDIWVQAPIAVAVSIFAMSMFGCTHPPGGATALIAIIGGKNVYALDFAFILTCLGAAIISVCIACLGNNLMPTRQYPLYWF